MAFVDLLHNNKTGRALEYVPTNALEIAGAFIGDLGMSIPSSVTKMTVEQILKNERNSLIKERFGGLEEVTGIKRKSRDPIGIRAELESQLSKLDSLIEEGRSNGDNRFSDIKTTQEIRQELVDVADFASEDASSAQARAKSTTSLVAGTGVGMVLGSFTDVVNLATMPLGASASMGILRAMGTEAAVNAGVELAQMPWTKEWNDELGREFGIKEGIEQIAMAAGAGGAITGGVRGLGKAMSYGSKWLGYSKIGDNPNIDPSVRDAAKYQEMTNHIDGALPERDLTKVSEADFIENRKNYAATQKAFNEKGEPIYGRADFYDMDIISYKADGEISDENIGRLFKKIDDEAIVFEASRFENRKSADDFIRKAPEGRDAFITQKTEDGKYVVLKVNKDAKVVSTPEGKIQEYKSFETAKSEADKLNKANPKKRYNPISFNKAEGKSAQAHVIIEGKFTKQELKSIKENPQFFKPVKKTVLDAENGITREGRIAYNKTQLESKFKGKGFEKDLDAMARGAHDATDLLFDTKVKKLDEDTVRKFDDMGQSKESMDVLTSRFEEIVSKNPLMKVIDDNGDLVSINEIMARLKDDELIERAITTCGVK